MFEENVVSASGVTYRMNSDSMEHYITDAGFAPYRRNGDFTDWDPVAHDALRARSVVAELGPEMI
jgi:hypothetical protein